MKRADFLHLYQYVDSCAKGSRPASKRVFKKLSSGLKALPEVQPSFAAQGKGESIGLNEARIILALFYLHSIYGSDVSAALARCVAEGVIAGGGSAK